MSVIDNEFQCLMESIGRYITKTELQVHSIPYIKHILVSLVLDSYISFEYIILNDNVQWVYSHTR